MAEERSRGFAAGGFVNGREEGEEEEEDEEEEAGPEAEASKSSRGGEEVEEEGWLRLGIGVGVTTSMSLRSPAKSSSTAARRRELDLFERSSTAPSATTSVGSMMPVFHVPVEHGSFYRRDIPWGFWKPGSPAMVSATSAFSPAAADTPLRRFMFPLVSSGAATEQLHVVSPPPRLPSQAAGVWFLLQASQNQEKEPFLPQIPKSYLRIKDGRMTVRLLKKYLVSKLGLEDESEVQIWCRGQQLHPFFTLQHVRDSIWRLRERPASLSLLSEPPVAENLMTLQYGRSS
ncbi:hypothetical protein HPP92_023020 [Vanilla planifolia]|uniref:RAWUL domain-containing protein n=1 Tax=Vanilla planifolia TaxID=51239 RepID=A0A835PV88_VANPL|nr:hypothetical protein HPP92_023020 [Vanilla planifolia]